MYASEEVATAWTPDIVGPIYKRQSLSLREVLNAHRSDKCTRAMATFVPDELIYEPDLSRKNFRKFNAVLALIKVSKFFEAYEKYINAENGGSYAFFALLDSCIGTMIGEVYSTKGDVLKISRDGLLILWKIQTDEFISKMVYNVILCAQRIQDSIAALDYKNITNKVDIIVSAGEVTFSVIGDDTARHYVIGGTPIEDLKFARRICLPGDLVLSSSAWDHCAPSQYEYVIKDSSNIKIIKVLGPPVDPSSQGLQSREMSPQVLSPIEKSASEVLSNSSDHSAHSDTQILTFQAARISVFEALRRRIGSQLETYMLPPVLRQIQREESLKNLTEVRQITVVCANVVPGSCSVYEFISMIDEVFKAAQSIAGRHSGYVSTMNLYDRDILVLVSFGLKVSDEDEGNCAENGIVSSLEIMKETKRVPGVKTVYVGVSTGMAFCGVIGHTVRRQYMILGTPVDKAIRMMQISFDKISCDYDTVLYSSLKKDKFRSRGMKNLKRFGNCHVYEYLNVPPDIEGFSNLDYTYPILGRFQELEYFKDILDDIGVQGRSYSGVLIEGAERSGKSRLLDAYVKIIRSREIKLLQLPLHPSYAEKAFSVLYHVLLELFDAADCTSVDDRERVLLNRLTNILDPRDFCYLNAIMRVRFPLSKEYCADTDWRRHTKTIKIFEAIMSKVHHPTVFGRLCILLDDVQHMDLISWQFLSSAINNDNVVIAMTLLEPISWDNLSQVEAGVCQDARLMKRSLVGLSPEYHAAFACQFFNVLAIPTVLEKILQKRSKNSVSWCEAFLIATLQVRAVKFVTMSPAQVTMHDLVFPSTKYLIKIPPHLTPEEMAPPLHWSQMKALKVCVSSSRPIGYAESNRDVTGLRIDIYNRMNSYEQDFIKCSATLGMIFRRRMLKTVMNNYAPLYTAKAVAEMIRLRILECARIQRKHFHADDMVHCTFKSRKTFSNMHHMVTCDCRPSRIFAARTLPSYANCKVLEFTVSSYCKLLYEILPPHEKTDYHTKAAGIIEKDARRCSTCGHGSFLILPTPEEPMQVSSFEAPSMLSLTRQRRGTMYSKHDRLDSKRNLVGGPVSDTERRRENLSIRRISILPVHDDDEVEGEVSGANETKEGHLSDYGKRVKHVSINPDAPEHSWESELKKFSHVDYRNCRCIVTISNLFWPLLHHVKNTKDVERLLKLMLQYGAGLIDTGQPLFATKFLAATADSIETMKLKEQLIVDAPDASLSRGRTLVLMGDAYLAYGNYSQATKFFTEAVSTRDVSPQTTKSICYNAIVEKLRHTFLGFPYYNLNRIGGEPAVGKLELSIYLERLSTVLMLQDQPKVGKLKILQAFRAAFESVGGFLEKGMVYLTAVRIYRHFDDLELLDLLEKPMMFIIEKKTFWNTPEEFVVVANVYKTVYESRALHGHLAESIEIGSKILKICNCLRLTRVKLAILPSLIEIMVWSKCMNEAVDLLRELYFLSKEDIDQSAITWYYALCLEFLLDAGLNLESYETCYAFYYQVADCKSRACVSRDPQSLLRLTTCLSIWQLRKTMAVSDNFVQNVEVFVKDIKHDKFSQIYNCVKGLECYLLVLKRRITIKKSSDLHDQMQNVYTLTKVLKGLADYSTFVKPFLSLLQSYMCLLRGRKSVAHIHVQRSEKWSTSQGNQLMLAWIKQNKRTWKEANYNNMAQYWVEHVANGDTVQWQDVDAFNLAAWSTILYPLPVPSSNI